MLVSRRETIGLVGASTAVALLPLPAIAQDLTTDTSPPRVPLDEFVQDATLLDALRRGVRRMKARKPSDPLSWFFQAAIHGVTLGLIQKASQIDPNIINVDQKKYWNQCPHFGQASANFLPWHRGYTYYFERILRAHTGEPRFSLPYWDYHRAENYRFPREFGLRTLDQPLDSDTANPLYHDERNIYFTDWQHWSDPNYKPYSQLTPEAVDWTPARDAPIFFGITERDGLGGTIADEDTSTRGRLESFPHDPIHRLVGGVIPQPDGGAATGGMANPPTAGFDPIFCVHHSNMDRLWAEWSRMPGKGWGKLPPENWLDAKPWTFFDVKLENGELTPMEVQRPRRDYFDYRALGISFKGEDLSEVPLALPPRGSTLFAAPIAAPSQAKLLSRIEALAVVSGDIPARISILTAPPNLQSTFLSTKSLTPKLLQQKRVLMRITGVNLGAANSMGYDVHLVRTEGTPPRRSDPSFVGMIALFRSDDPSAVGHQQHAGAIGPVGKKPSDTFDVTDALRAAGESDPRKLSVVIVPFSLSSSDKGDIVDTVGIQFDGIEFYSKG